MAQAARLNLRMQKELKLLLTDPPHGATFPHLSPSSDLASFSLTSIVALIQGPEGTVYEKGVFKINIQIPERYPFQPPVVTFSTPIYHPNIDTGGRICLDILNLPPKGAWQPSINISTVLTSIGLLLSEPNPDDGLMCEASKEYKYNKQVFDQKARSMTEKYAKIDASPSHDGLQSLTDSSTTEDKASEVVKTDTYDTYVSAIGFKKISGVGRKLSLNASGSIAMESDFEMKEVPSDTSISKSKNQEPNQDSKYMPSETVTNSDHDQDKKPPIISSKKLCLSRMNLQKEVPDSTKRLDDLMPSHLVVQKENLAKAQLRNQDSKESQLEYSKSHAMSVSKSANIQDNKPRPAISSKKLCLSNRSLQKEVPDSTRLEDMASDLDAQKGYMTDIEKGSDIHGMGIGRKMDVSGSSTRDREMGLKKAPSNESLEFSEDHVINMKKSDHDQHAKRQTISSKKLCLSNKNLQKEVPDPTKRVDDVLHRDLGARMEKLHEVQKETNIPEYAVGSKKLSGIGRKLSLDTPGSNPRVSDTGMNKAPSNKAPSNESLEFGEYRVVNVKNTDHDQHSKRPIISSRKLCLSNKNLQKEVPDPTKIVDDVLPRDLGARMENMLEVQKETNIPEYAVGSKRISGVGRKLSLDASGSNTRVSDMGMNKAPSNKSQIQIPNQDFKEMLFQYSKNQVTTMTNSDHDQGTKPPAISSKKLCLSSKKIPKDSIKRKNDTMSIDLDAQKENLLEVQKNSIDSSCSTGPKRKKLGLTGKRPLFGFSVLTKNSGSDNNVDAGGLGISKRSKATQADRKGRTPLQVLAEKDNPKLDMKADAKMHNSKHNAERSDDDITGQEGLADPEGAIVLDSEDSEEEMARSSSRHLISRRRMVR